MAKKLGFTLAEVLITLGIIGVVAAITIPALINNTNQVEYKAALKKVVSTLNQAVTMNLAQDSVDFSQLTSGACTSVGTVCYMFNNRMNVINIDSAADETLDPSGSSYPVIASDANYTLFFNDGTVFSFPMTCNTPKASDNASICKGIIDINGGKGPNRLTNCNSDLRANTEPAATCNIINTRIADRFSVRFSDGVLTPNGPGTRSALYN